MLCFEEMSQLLAAPIAPSQRLNDFKTLVEIGGNIVEAMAILVGGIWAYFRFVKGRTCRMRTEISLSGEWIVVNGLDLLQTRVSIKNIGSSKVGLIQRGTGLRVSVLSEEQAEPPGRAQWRSLRVFIIFEEHEWIEPEETVSDEVLLNLNCAEPVSTLLEARLVLARSWPRKNVAVFARRVIGVDSKVEVDRVGVSEEGSN